MRLVLIFMCATLCLGVIYEMIPAYSISEDILNKPNWSHPLGTNDLGQDVLVGLLHAAPVTIGIGLITATLALGICAIIACSCCVVNNPTRRVLLSMVDLLQIIPNILIMLLVSALQRPDTIGIILLIALTTWHDDVRVLQTSISRQMTRENVQVARLMGGSWTYCIWRHILPAIKPTLAGLYVQNVMQAAMRAAGLSFLGLTDPRLITWGRMMQDSVDHLHSPAGWRLLCLPLLAFVTFLMTLMAIGRRVEANHDRD